jgi:prophage regulatory protein
MPSRQAPSRQPPKIWKVDVQVVGAAEIAEMLGGLSRQRVSQLTAEDGFPAPLQRLRMGSVWRYADIAAWAERTGRSVHPISTG